MLANFSGDWYWPVLAIIILFGGSQLPKLARNAGLAMKEFRTAHTEAMSSPLSPSEQSTVSRPTEPVLGAGPTPSPAVMGTTAPAAPLPAGIPSTSATPEERITLTRAELDALLAHREAQARAANGANPPASS